jgi:hypothetical protein
MRIILYNRYICKYRCPARGEAVEWSEPVVMPVAFAAAIGYAPQVASRCGRDLEGDNGAPTEGPVPALVPADRAWLAQAARGRW